MPDQPQYVLITRQPGAIGGAEENVYGPSLNRMRLVGAGEILAAGATPPMTFDVLELQPAKWDDA